MYVGQDSTDIQMLIAPPKLPGSSTCLSFAVDLENILGARPCVLTFNCYAAPPLPQTWP